MNLQIVDPPKDHGVAPSAGSSSGLANAQCPAASSLRRVLGAGMALFAIVLSGASHGGVVEFTNLADFNTSAGLVGPGSEEFVGYSGFSLAPYTGTVGALTWSASAATGVFAGSGVMSTDYALDPLTFTFTTGGGLVGVGGQFFGSDSNFDPLSSIVGITITLADGSSHPFTRTIGTREDFWGFYSSDSAIASMTITASVGAFPSADAMTFRGNVLAPNEGFGSVPEPSSIALVAAALGLAAGARRRKAGA